MQDRALVPRWDAPANRVLPSTSTTPTDVRAVDTARLLAADAVLRALSATRVISRL